MIDFLTIDNELLNGSARLMQEAIRAKGWQAETPYIGSPHLFINRKDERELLHAFLVVPPGCSFAAAHLANDKFATYSVLKSRDIDQPETILVVEEDLNAGLAEAMDLIKKYGQVVVKPIDGGHGKGVTVAVKAKKRLEAAIKIAKEHNKTGTAVIVQQMLDGPLFDIRISVVGGRAVGAILRTPAAVTGDGKKTVGELIKHENETCRGEPYKAKLARVDMAVAKKYLGDKLDHIPGQGEKVTVVGVANYGQGGELIDITDNVPAWLIKEAEKIAAILELPVCGVDFLSLKDISKKLKRTDVYFIEANKCPSLAIHDRPTTGKDRGAVKAFVEYLDRLP